MDFFTNCYLPSYKKEFKVSKLKFGDYLELNFYIDNSDYVSANNIFEKICKNSLDYPKKICNLDKFFLLVHLKNVFINPVLKLSGKDENGESATYEAILKDILNTSKKYNFEGLSLPKSLYYEDSEDILKETSLSIEDIKKHINNNKFLLFEAPDVIKKIPKIYINCFDNTLFYFCKLLYKTNLKNLYRKIIFLKKNFNFSLNEIYGMSPKELDIFLNTK